MIEKNRRVARMKWFTKDDQIPLNIKQLSFAKKRKGRKPTLATNAIPSKLTRKDCESKVSEVLDLTRKIALLTAAKQLLSSFDTRSPNLSHKKIDRDESISDNLRPIWDSHFQMMNEI